MSTLLYIDHCISLPYPNFLKFQEKSTGHELILQYAEISEEIRLATNTYNAAVSHEESVAKDYDSLSGEART